MCQVLSKAGLPNTSNIEILNFKQLEKHYNEDETKKQNVLELVQLFSVLAKTLNIMDVEIPALMCMILLILGLLNF